MKLLRSAGYLGIIFVSIILVTGCTTTSPQPVVVMKPVSGTMISFNESDNGKAYEIPRNTEFFVNVTESFATGTKWHPQESSGLELLDDGYYADSKSVRFDIGGTRSWRLRATGTGQQSFEADFYQFSDSDKVQEHYVLTLQVRPDQG
jgi:predicted secreted protein